MEHASLHHWDLAFTGPAKSSPRCAQTANVEPMHRQCLLADLVAYVQTVMQDVPNN